MQGWKNRRTAATTKLGNAGLTYLNRHSSVFAFLLIVLELLDNEILMSCAVATIHQSLLVASRTLRVRFWRLPSLSLAQVGAGDDGLAGGGWGAGLSHQSCRLLGLLNEDRGALNMMDDHRGGRHHLRFDGGALRFWWG